MKLDGKNRQTLLLERKCATVRKDDSNGRKAITKNRQRLAVFIEILPLHGKPAKSA
jgi:hypothetical protein